MTGLERSFQLFQLPSAEVGPWATAFTRWIVQVRICTKMISMFRIHGFTICMENKNNALTQFVIVLGLTISSPSQVFERSLMWIGLTGSRFKEFYLSLCTKWFILFQLSTRKRILIPVSSRPKLCIILMQSRSTISQKPITVAHISLIPLLWIYFPFFPTHCLK